MNKKKVVRLTESDLHSIIKESVNRILHEVTDYGNNIFGSADIGQAYDVDYDDGYFELKTLSRDVIEKFGNKSDFIENYTNKGTNAYLYGNIEERKDDLMKIKEYCEKLGYSVHFTNVKRYSGYNKYPAVMIEFKKQ